MLLIERLSSNVVAYTATGLAASTPYHFRVRAYTSQGVSTVSNVAQATTLVDPGGSNQAPTAFDGSDTLKTTDTLEGTLDASDADADPLTYIIVAGPTHGSLLAPPDAFGNFRYQPDPGATAGSTDSIRFHVNDG